MSKIGRQPIQLPDGVTVTSDATITVTGPKGTLTQAAHRAVKLAVADGQITVSAARNDRASRALHGLYRTLVANMVTGVTEGFEKVLELQGVGYRASLVGQDLVLQVGFSHPVTIHPPEGIEISVQKNSITIRGANKQQVGELAAVIRRVRPPEPYKGKGIRYRGEVVRRKAGKAAKAAGTK